MQLGSKFAPSGRPAVFGVAVWAALTGAIGVAVLAGGCRPDSAPQELETVEVSGPLDAELSFEEDVQAARRAPELAGVLPSDFPVDFPVYKPASVVDFGALGAGRYYVVLFTPDARLEVDRFVNAAAPRAGWSLRSAEQDAGRSVFSKGGWTMRVQISAAAGGTELRFEY